MITDPEAIRFANEVARPLAEKARALFSEINAAAVVWYGGMSGKFPNDSTLLNDGRDAEGISRLTGADVTNLIGNLIAASGSTTAEILSKPCVRPLSAS